MSRVVPWWVGPTACNLGALCIVFAIGFQFGLVAFLVSMGVFLLVTGYAQQMEEPL